MPLPDFNAKGSKESWYDLRDDWDLIESSLAKQYGIRIRRERDMPFSEFCALVAGIMPDTPLGQVVAIRAEKDPKAIKAFSPDQKRIHKEWRSREAAKAVQNPEQLERDMEGLAKMLAGMFGKRGDGR